MPHAKSIQLCPISFVTSTTPDGVRWRDPVVSAGCQLTVLPRPGVMCSREETQVEKRPGHPLRVAPTASTMR